MGLWGLLWAYWVVLRIGGVGFSQVLSLVFSAFCVLFVYFLHAWGPTLDLIFHIVYS